MAYWIVYVEDYEQWRGRADGPDGAIKAACDQLGFDGPAAMAGEYEGCTEQDVKATRIDCGF